MIVIDASVAVKWFVEEEGHEAAVELLSSRVEKCVPDFALAEIANVLRRKVKKGEIDREQARRAIDTLPEAFARVVPSATLVRGAWQIAEALDHSVYDCFYLACAEQQGLKLVTADSRFLDKARVRGRASSLVRLSHPFTS